MEETLWSPFEAWKARPAPATLIPLLEAAHPRVYSLCHQILRHPQDAEDASQLVCLQLVDALGDLKDATHLRHWIHRASFHVALNQKRSRTRRQEHEREKAELAPMAAPPAAPDAGEAVYEHLATLDADARALMVSRYFEQRSVQDLAAAQGCSTVTLWKKLEKAREELLQALLRSGLGMAVPDLDAILTGIGPVTAPSGPLGAAVLAKAGGAASGATPLVALFGGGAMKLKTLTALFIFGLAGAGFLGAALWRSPLPPVAAPKPLGTVSLRASAQTALQVPPPAAAPTPVDGPTTRAKSPVGGEPPVSRSPRGTVQKSILKFMKMQHEDGSWGDGPATVGSASIDRTGVTSLALLAFLGSGYSPRSIDKYDDLSPGNSVKRAMEWILKNQRADGSFVSYGETTVDQAFTALALSEAYGMTATAAYKEPTQRAIQALTKLQTSDGSWGNPASNMWAMMALTSARLSEVKVDPGVLTLTQSYLRSQLDAKPDVPSMIGSFFLNRDRSNPAVAKECALIAAQPPDPQNPDLLSCYMRSMALFQYDGPTGACWKQWGEPMKQAVLRVDQDGLWQGRTQSEAVVQSSLAVLSLQIFYRYADVFSTGTK